VDFQIVEVLVEVDWSYTASCNSNSYNSKNRLNRTNSLVP